MSVKKQLMLRVVLAQEIQGTTRHLGTKGTKGHLFWKPGEKWKSCVTLEIGVSHHMLGVSKTRVLFHICMCMCVCFLKFLLF